MTRKIFLHIVLSILNVLAKRKEVSSLHQSFQDYLASASEDQIASDIKETHLFVVSPTGRAPKNGLLKAFVAYLNSDVAKVINLIPLDFYTYSLDQKIEFLEKGLKLPPVFVDALSSMTYQDVIKDIFRLVKAADPQTEQVIIQAARDPEPQVKESIRHEIQKKFPHAIVAFMVAKQLFGGLRIFKEGELIDNSWFGKIQRLTSQL